MQATEKEHERSLLFDLGVDGPTMDTRLLAQTEIAQPLPPKDKNFVRNYHYDRDLRWLVTNNVAFSYEQQLAVAVSSIDR